MLMPNCSNLLLMADLPEPIPPVKPIIFLEMANFLKQIDNKLM